MSKKNLDEWWQEIEEGVGAPASAGQAAKMRYARGRYDHSKYARQTRPLDAELETLAAQEDGLRSFDFTYQASRHEFEWIMRSLGPFYEHRWIEDVLRLVKGGKEANVYLCASGPQVPAPYLAAKVYRPRKFRNLKNDHLYREGRNNLDSEGREIRNAGMLHAMQKRTSYGLELLHTSWLEHEYSALQRLHAAGADVPRPYACDHNAVLMEYIGDPEMAAAPLSAQRLPLAEARRLYRRVLDNIETMLRCERIHGDLSAYNILYWEGQIKLIDFPQAIAPQENRSALRIFTRDVQRISEYFARQGVSVQPAESLAAELWTAYRHPLLPEIPAALLE
jgi:RIO kinase 1